jgi:hypothetical protein
VERLRFELKHLETRTTRTASPHQNHDLGSRRGAGGAISEARTEGALAFFQAAEDYFRREVMLGYRQGAAQLGSANRIKVSRGPCCIP